MYLLRHTIERLVGMDSKELELYSTYGGSYGEMSPHRDYFRPPGGKSSSPRGEIDVPPGGRHVPPGGLRKILIWD